MAAEMSGLVIKDALVTSIALTHMVVALPLLREELATGPTPWASITSKERQVPRDVDGPHIRISSLVDALMAVNNSLSLEMQRQLVDSKQHVVELPMKADMETIANTMMDIMVKDGVSN